MLFQLAGQRRRLLTRLCQIVSSGLQALRQLGNPVGVRGRPGNDSLQLHGRLVRSPTCLANLLIERITSRDAIGMFRVHLLQRRRLRIDLRGQCSDLVVRRSLVCIELCHAACKHNPQPCAQLIAQGSIPLRLRRLPLERGHLPRYFLEDVVHARKILFGGFQSQLRKPLLRLEARNPGGFFDNAATIERLRAEKLADALLADNRVGLSPKARAHKDVLNIAQPAHLAIQQILRIPGAKQPSRNRQLSRPHRSAVELPPANLENHVACNLYTFRGSFGCFAFDDCPRLRLRDCIFCLLRSLLPQRRLIPVADVSHPLRRMLVVDDDLRAVRRKRCSVVHLWIHQRKGDLRHARGLPVAGSGEDHIFHLYAAQALGRLFSQNPRNRVGNVRFTTAIGSHDRGDPFAGELNLCPVAKGLESKNLDLF